MARRRKLNVKFLVLLGVPLVLIVGPLVVYKVAPQLIPARIKWIVRGTPAEHYAQANELYKQGKYEEAAEKYMRGMQLKGGTPDASEYVWLGDCRLHMVLKDPENIRRAYATLEQALVIDPSYAPALQKLLDLSIDDAEQRNGGRQPQQWEFVKKYADKLVGADPKNHKARIAQHRSVIERAMAGVEGDSQRVVEAVEALTRMSQEQPFDADTIFYVVQAKVSKGQERIRQNDRPGATAQFAEAMKLVEDALAAHPDDPMMHYRAGQCVRMLGYAERSPGQPVKYVDRSAAELEKAGELIKPDHPEYGEVKVYLGRQLGFMGETAAAEKIFRALHAERPDDIDVTLSMAELLGRQPDKRTEALDLLDHMPPADPTKVWGIKALMYKNYEVVALATSLSIKLDLLQTLRDKKDVDQMLAQIDEGYARLIATPGLDDSPTALHLRGRMELARNQNLQAVQTLDRALKRMPAPANIVQLDERYKLMFNLATAEMRTDQTGDAKVLLTQLVKDNDRHIPARLMLVELLMRERDFDGARPHLDVLSKALPDNPKVQQLIMAAMDKDKDKAKLEEMYNKMPQGTRQEMVDKAQMAQYMGKKDEGIKLLEMAYAQGAGANPNEDVQLGVMLAQTYAQNGDKSKAVALIDELVAKNPDKAGLKLRQREIAGGDVTEVTRELVSNIKDPFDKEMALLQISAQEDKDEEMLQHLNAAAALKPDDGRVNELLFRVALQQKQWDKAASLADKLAKMNQDQTGGLTYRIQLSMAKGQVPEATDLAIQLTQKMPEFAQSWVTLAQVLAAQGKYSEATTNYMNARAKQSQNFDALRGLIDCAYKLGQFNAAWNYIQEGRKMFPNNVVLRELELRHQLVPEWGGDPEKVIQPRQELLDKAIAAKDPGEARAWLMLGDTYVAVAKSKDTPQAAAPFYEKARDTYQKASAKWPDEPRFVQAYSDCSMKLKKFEDGEKAIKALADREAWKGKADPTLMLADYYAHARKLPEEEKVLRDYLATAPQAILVETNLATMLAAQGKLDDAMKVLEANIDNPTIRKQRVQLLTNAGRVADAEKEVNAALASTADPSADLLVMRAVVYVNSGRPSEAMGVLDKVLASNPNNIDALFYRGTITLLSFQNIDRAIADLQAVRDAYQGNTAPDSKLQVLKARLMLSQAYQRKGDAESAIRELEAAVRENPTEKPARVALVNLYQQAKPPRWTDAERSLADARKLPELANDVDIIHAQAKMWLARKDNARALDAITTALKLNSNDPELFHTYLETLLRDKQYRLILQTTDPLVQKKVAPWWAYAYRGRARKALDDKDAAMVDYQAGMDVAAAAKDDTAVEQIARSIADEIGAKQAIARVITRAEKGENRWRIMVAQLMLIDGDLSSAITQLERVIDDSKASPEEVETAERLVGTMYLRLDPPDAKKAVAVYQKLLERLPADKAITDQGKALDKASVLNNLACTMIIPNSGSTAKDAIKYSQQAYNLLDQRGIVNAYIFDTHGYMLVLTGRVDEGMNLLNKAIDKASTDQKPFADAYYHLGEAYLAMATPNTMGAQEALERAQLVLEQTSKSEEKPVDAELKSKIDKALERAKQPAPAAAAKASAAGQ